MCASCWCQNHSLCLSVSCRQGTSGMCTYLGNSPSVLLVAIEHSWYTPNFVLVFTFSHGAATLFACHPFFSGCICFMTSYIHIVSSSFTWLGISWSEPRTGMFIKFFDFLIQAWCTLLLTDHGVGVVWQAFLTVMWSHGVEAFKVSTLVVVWVHPAHLVSGRIVHVIYFFLYKLFI